MTGIYYLPDGNTKIMQPINPGFVNGQVYQGCGVGQQKSLSHPQRGTVSAWVWDGVAMGYDHPMVRVEGSGFSFRDLCLYGRPDNQDTTTQKPAQGIFIHKPRPGIGTGKILLDHCYIEDCEVGIQTGLPNLPNNADNGDNCTFRKVTFRDCDIGYKSYHIQNHQNNFYECIFRFCDTCFDISGGGKMLIQECHSFDTLPTTLLNISGTSKDLWWRNGMFTVSNTTWDAQKPEGSPLLKMNKAPGTSLRCMVNFDAFIIGNFRYPPNNSMFQISGGSVCHLHDGIGLQSGCLDWWDEGNAKHNGRPRFLIDNCRVDKTIIDPLQLFSRKNSLGGCDVKVRDCQTWDGIPIADTDGWVRLQGQMESDNQEK